MDWPIIPVGIEETTIVTSKEAKETAATRSAKGPKKSRPTPRPSLAAAWPWPKRRSIKDMTGPDFLLKFTGSRKSGRPCPRKPGDLKIRSSSRSNRDRDQRGLPFNSRSNTRTKSRNRGPIDFPCLSLSCDGSLLKSPPKSRRVGGQLTASPPLFVESKTRRPGNQGHRPPGMRSSMLDPRPGSCRPHRFIGPAATWFFSRAVARAEITARDEWLPLAAPRLTSLTAGSAG